jgi:DNA-directed RNA polymerase subunit RPC12/RpoP
MKCPREDPQNLSLGDVFEMACPQCGAKIEFWKGDAIAKCPKCGARVENPHAEKD